MPLRDEDEVRAALLEQADDNDGATQLLNILRWSLAGNAAAKRARLLSFLDGPASRRRVGWLDLLLQQWKQFAWRGTASFQNFLPLRDSSPPRSSLPGQNSSCR